MADQKSADRDEGQGQFPAKDGDRPQRQLTPLPENVLFTERGNLRFFWKLLLYYCIYETLKTFLGVLLHVLAEHAIPWLWRALIAEFGVMLAAMGAGWLLARLENRPFGSYGFPLGRNVGQNLLVGALWGLTALSLLVFGIYISGTMNFAGIALHGIRLWKFALFWGAFFVFVGCYEEFLMRGYSQFTLATGIGFWPAAVVLSLVFAYMHFNNPGETSLGLAAIVAIALFFCLTLRRTGTLWFAVGFHAAWDWSESFLYSVPDSGLKVPGHLLNSSFHGSRWITGGSVGPEGSVFVFVLIGGISLLFSRLYPEVKFVTPIEASPSQPPPVAGNAVQS